MGCATMGKQFEKVDCARGAPMGRADYGQRPGEGLRVRLFRVRLDTGGYDDGGRVLGGRCAVVLCNGWRGLSGIYSRACIEASREVRGVNRGR